MPYIPHTEEDINAMLAAIGAKSIEELFAEVPPHLRCQGLSNIPDGMTEIQINQLMRERGAQNHPLTCFAGAGAYEHHIPAAVWEITTRGEFYSAYTPYQAEASQGTLQLLYEYQSMMTRLTAMDVSNASLYDGASALAEAVLMAVRVKKGKAKQILMPTTVHPRYRAVTQTIVKNQQIELLTVPYAEASGTISLAELNQVDPQSVAALVIPYPNFFGKLEAVHELTRWAHERGILVIAVANPIALAVLSPPGEWGDKGADIVCGEGQPLGIPLSGGGPYFGFMCAKKANVRQMPGRIVGRTVDLDGKSGYTLTLQAREQHIRRSQATSNICTNQGLMVTAATIFTALLGGQGLQNIAKACHANTRYLLEQLTALPKVEVVFAGAFFHEIVLRLPMPADLALEELAQQGILGGYALAQDYPELNNCLLICATELRTEAELERYAACLNTIILQKTQVQREPQLSAAAVA